MTTEPINLLKEESDDSMTAISGASYSAKGHKEAGLLGGSVQALLPKLHAVYARLICYIRQNEMEQRERKKLPRIPAVEDAREFWGYSGGLKLADLHINYEGCPYKSVRCSKT